MANRERVTVEDANRRAVLLTGAVAWVVENGLQQLSLRPLAAALGTSARMLVYHFGSREGLVSAVLDRLADDWELILAELEQTGPDPTDALTHLWRHVRTDAARRQHLFLLEVYVAGVVTQDPLYRPFVERALGAWLGALTGVLARGGLGPRAAKVRAMVVMAAVDGLLTQAFVNDSLPVEDAFADLVTLLKRA